MIASARENGRTVLVTGAGSGLGAAITLRLSEAGYAVHLVGRRVEALEEVANLCEGPELPTIHPLDVTNRDAVEGAVTTAVELHGRLDVVINNAGIFRPAPASRVEMEEWNEVLATNVTGGLVISQAAVEAFRSQAKVAEVRGHLIFVNSGAGDRGYAPSASYAASKHALRGLSDSLRREVASDGIQVSDLVVATAVESRLSGRTGVTRLPADTVARTVQAVIEMPGPAVLSRVELGQLSDWCT